MTGTKDLTPKDDSIKSPLRELDWTDDDYTMEVVSGRIYDRNMDEIFDNLSLLNDRGGETTYFPSMAERGEHMIKIAIPRAMLHMLEQISKEYHTTDLADAARICMLHGCSIYEHKYGAEIESYYHDNFKKQLKHDYESVIIHMLPLDIQFIGLRYSCRIEARLFHLLSRFSAHAGASKQFLAGIFVLYSLRTHPALKEWYGDIDRILDEVSVMMNLRTKMLK